MTNEKIDQAMRAAAAAFDDLRPEAVDDLMLHANEFYISDAGEVLHNSGIDPVQFLTEARDGTGGLHRPFWFTTTEPINPFSKEAFSIKGQGEVVRKYGLARAEEMAREAGVKVGSTHPNSDAPPTNKRSTNCFHADAWNVTQQGRLVQALGLAKANAIAAAVGCKVGDTKPATKKTPNAGGVPGAPPIKQLDTNAQNPWAGGVGWSKTRQAKIWKDNPEQARKLAAGADSELNPLHPPGAEPTRAKWLSKLPGDLNAD